MKKPIKPSKNKIRQYDIGQYQHIVGQRRKGGSIDFVVVFPCPTCTAACHPTGWIYVPDQQPDPVEGRKMWDTIPCPTCSNNGSRGTGVVSKKIFNTIISAKAEKSYKFYCDLYERDKKEWNVAQSILKKCSPAEKKVAKKWFNIVE